MLHTKIKLQAGVDFLISYGIAFVIIFIAIAVILQTGLLNPLIVPQSCTPFPGFACSQFSLNAMTGALTFTFSQATGSTIVLNGFACANSRNAIGDNPQYGNIYVTNGLQAGIEKYYPPYNSPVGGNILTSIPTTTTTTLQAYCYNGGGHATGNLGNAFFGYVWLNYTVSGYGSIVQQIAAITVKYS